MRHLSILCTFFQQSLNKLTKWDLPIDLEYMIHGFVTNLWSSSINTWLYNHRQPVRRHMTLNINIQLPNSFESETYDIDNRITIEPKLTSFEVTLPLSSEFRTLNPPIRFCILLINADRCPWRNRYFKLTVYLYNENMLVPCLNSPALGFRWLLCLSTTKQKLIKIFRGNKKKQIDKKFVFVKIYFIILHQYERFILHGWKMVTVIIFSWKL